MYKNLNIYSDHTNELSVLIVKTGQVKEYDFFIRNT
jgi:hypothetical protein